MPLSKETLLTANLLIGRYGNEAEEYATKKMWELRQDNNAKEADMWLSLIQGIKEVRILRESLDKR